MKLTVTKTGPLKGAVCVPADKSICHRALLLAAMCEGPSTIKGISPGLDVEATIAFICGLGISVERTGANAVVHPGTMAMSGDFDCGNSGTTMRLGIGSVASLPGPFRFTGDPSLVTRPMARVAQPLREMGAEVELSARGTAPVLVNGGPLTGIEHTPAVASAQVKSAVLIAGLRAEGTTTVTEPTPTRDHTERLLASIGAPIRRTFSKVSVSRWDRGSGFDLEVPGDISSAAYLIAAATLVPGSVVEITGVGLNPTRTGFIEVMRSMGADIETTIDSEEPEPVGRVVVKASHLLGVEVGAELVPGCIDELPLLILMASVAEGKSVISGAGELRFKESDRLSAMARCLRTFGTKFEETSDGMVIEGGDLEGGSISSMGDHRIALTMAIAGLVSKEAVSIDGWEAADVSYPGLPGDLRELG